MKNSVLEITVVGTELMGLLEIGHGRLIAEQKRLVATLHDFRNPAARIREVRTDLQLVELNLSTTAWLRDRLSLADIGSLASGALAPERLGLGLGID